MIRKADEKVVRCIGGAGGHAVKRRRRRAKRGTQENLRGRTSLDDAGTEEERGGEAGESKGREEDGW